MSKSLSFLDVLFEGRNKAYGAYDLRVHYTERLQKSVLLAVAMAGTVIWLSWWTSLHFTKDAPMRINDTGDGGLYVTTVNMKPLPSPGPAPVENVKSEQLTVVKDKDVPDKPDDKPEPVKPVANSGSGNGSGNGETGPGGNGSGGGGETAGGGTQPFTPPVPEIPEAAIDLPEVMPEYPGGEDAMMAFLSRNMKYPAMAKERGIEGRVVMAFVVNEKGAITHAEIVKGIGYGCDEEALRVLKMMPVWKAGEQNGRKVRVNYILPVTFKLE